MKTSGKTCLEKENLGFFIDSFIKTSSFVLQTIRPPHGEWGNGSWAGLLTTAGEADGLQQPLVSSRGQRQREHHHGALGGPHHQAGAEPAVPLPGEGLAEVEGGEDLWRLAVDAGHAGAAGAAERAVLGIWGENEETMTGGAAPAA